MAWISVLLQGSVVFGAKLLFEMLAAATAADDNRGDDNDRGNHDDDGDQGSVIHALPTSAP